MANSRSSDQNNQGRISNWIFRRRNLITSIIGVLIFIISLILSDVVNSQKPYFLIDFPTIKKLIFDISVSILFSFITQIILLYIDNVILGFYHLRTQFRNDFTNAINALSSITKDSISKIEQNTNESTKNLSNKIGETFHTSFYNLLSNENARKNFEDFANCFKDVTGNESPLRGVVLDFIVRSLASIGENGFTMVDAKVDSYVQYISETVRKSTNINMTCVVRPFWFVEDNIPNISIASFEPSHQNYGKGEHLGFFNNQEGEYQRQLIVDENMLAEIFLTAWIDKYFIENVTRNLCPVCIICKDSTCKCPFHNERITVAGINDIPEIWWFDNKVNTERGVDLVYTFVRAERRKTKALEELDDRIYISEPKPPLDIRFNFISRESGLLRIKWGKKAQQLSRINIPNSSTFIIRDPQTEPGKDNKLHRYFKDFKSLLGAERHDNPSVVCINYLEELIHLITILQEGNNRRTRFAYNIGNIADERLRRLLSNGSKEFSSKIIDSTKMLVEEFRKKTLFEIYQDLVRFYQINGIPIVAYLVTFDMLYPEYPIRIASWQMNWEGILKKCDTKRLI